VLEKEKELFIPGDLSMCMFLIFAGTVEISTKMDNGFEYTIDRCNRGCVINSESFLVEDILKVKATTVNTVHIMTIDKSRFLRIIKRDRPLMK
jgi:CRP-like cAMP-binding protein